MANGVTRVQPGDLITAAGFNTFADLIDDLEQRVAKLENASSTANGVTVQPLVGSVHPGDEITVKGTNFAQPVLLNVVMLDNVRITQFNPGTDDTHLVFNVPDIGNLPRSVTLSVTNSLGSAATTVNVQPVTNQVPVGTLVATPVPVNLGTINVGQTITLPFTLDSQTTIPEMYALSVSYTSVVGTATAGDWLAKTTIKNQTNQTITSATIANGSPVTVNVAVIIPTGATSANLVLQAASVHAPNDPLLKASRVVPIPVGGTVVVSDPRVHFDQLLVSPASRLGSDPVLGLATVIKGPVASTTLVRVNAAFEVATTYNFSAKVTPPDTTKWTVALDPATPASASQGPANPRQIIVQLVAGTVPDNLSSRTLEIHAGFTVSGQAADSWFSVPIENG